MSTTRKKLQRIRVLEQVRQSRVEAESVNLARIREFKVKTVKELKHNQNEYMKGIETLNTVRTSNSRENLQVMEETLDFLKAKWMRLYQDLQQLERAESQQLEILGAAHRDLRAVGNLAEKLEFESRVEANKIEQKALDERAIVRAWNLNSRNQ
jgi:flagellar biosynthesis chaperone FliJ